MAEFIHFFQKEVEKPGLFSLFHIISLVVIIGLTVLISYLFRNSTRKTYKRIILTGWIILLILEVIKQVVKSFYYGDPSYFKYSFYHLPFHLCSTIYYIVPILLFTDSEKHKALHDALTGFMCFFVLYAGIGVIFYNEIVMSTLLYTNIQTMIHHGMQVVLGVFMIVWNRNNINFKTFLHGLIVLGIFTVLAIIVNVALTPISDGIDMFYVNPIKNTSLPVVGVIQEKYGFVLYLIVYLLINVTLAFITYTVSMLIIHKFNFKELFIIDN